MRWLVLVACLSCCAAAATAGGARTAAADCPATLANELASTGTATQLVTVVANPGVRYRYHRVVCGDWWVEDARSPWYNRFKHVPCGSRPSFRVTSEDMSRSPTAYRHLAVSAYNR